MKTDNHIDTALRSVMEHRAERIPALSDDFAQQVMSKMNVRKESAKPKRTASFFILHFSLFTRRFAAGFSIAAALLITFLIWPESHKETTTQQEVQPIVAKAEPQPVPQPIIEEKEEEVLAEVLAEVQPAAQPVKKRKEIGRKQSAPIEEPVPIEAEPMFTEEPVPSYNPTIQDPFLLAAEFAQEIRSHGERLDREIAQMMIK